MVKNCSPSLMNTVKTHKKRLRAEALIFCLFVFKECAGMGDIPWLRRPGRLEKEGFQF